MVEAMNAEAHLSVERKVTTRGRLRVRLDRWMADKHRMCREYEVPAEHKVQIEIPGGGDWSNMTVDASDLHAVVTWETVIYDD